MNKSKIQVPSAGTKVDSSNQVEQHPSSHTIGNTMLAAVLRLPLKKKWFEMTKAGVKTEDYREITRYWQRRLIKGYYNNWSDFDKVKLMCVNAIKKEFKFNIMALGYPSKQDTGRILKLEHKGIEIRTGKPEWGAEPNKLYFVILHGAVIA